ncbi:ABC transporter permease [Kordiimonas aestuarii]|uniref:ABC transporter permease n=1 Tax=Kordiimonas aestuarii TaxID=1005925 RepID=UPI0021D3DD52|nr:FtsX-like permease family protein [Kordiimonas aestuarii]
MSDIYLIFKNLTRKPLRLFLTCFAIMVAFLIFGVVTTLKDALNSGIELSADNRLVVVNSINFTQPLPYAYVNKVKAIEGVKDVVHMNWFGGYYQEPANQLVTMAVDPENYLKVYEEVVLSDAERDSWFRNQRGMLIGRAIADAYGWKVGDIIPMSSNIFSNREGGHTWEMEVSGIFDGRDEQFGTNFAVFHYKYFMETQTFGGDWVGWLTLTTDDPALNEQVAKTIDEEFANSEAQTDTSTEKAFNKAFIEQIGNIGLMIFGIVFTAFFTILLVVGNTMILAVRERTGEIATLKTLGFTAKRIFTMILAESMLLAFIGGLAGLGLAYMIVEGAKAFLAQFLPGLVLSDTVALQAVGFMALLGLVTGLVPAINAYKLNIVTAFSRR